MLKIPWPGGAEIFHESPKLGFYFQRYRCVWEVSHSIFKRITFYFYWGSLDLSQSYVNTGILPYDRPRWLSSLSSFMMIISYHFLLHPFQHAIHIFIRHGVTSAVDKALLNNPSVSQSVNNSVQLRVERGMYSYWILRLHRNLSGPVHMLESH
jgi:hypothetical protein